MHTIDTTIEISAPCDRIVEALTSQAGYRGWFVETATFDGTHASFSFARPEGARTVRFRVDHRDARGIAMTCTSEENNPDWLGTRLAISVEGNRLRLVHAGYPEKNEVYERCAEAWAYFLTSLKRYVETGRGTPFPAA